MVNGTVIFKNVFLNKKFIFFIFTLNYLKRTNKYIKQQEKLISTVNFIMEIILNK